MVVSAAPWSLNREAAEGGIDLAVGNPEVFLKGGDLIRETIPAAHVAFELNQQMHGASAGVARGNKPGLDLALEGQAVAVDRRGFHIVLHQPPLRRRRENLGLYDISIWKAQGP